MPGLITVGVPYVTEAYAPRSARARWATTSPRSWPAGSSAASASRCVTAATSWRVALGLLALLPLASTLADAPRPPGRAPGPRAGPRAVAPARGAACSRNRALVAATLAGSGLFFSFQGAFSYIDFRLERPPFALSPALSGLVFLVWVDGRLGPLAGRVADRRGWNVVALGGLVLRGRAGSRSRSSDVLPLVIVGLALVTLGNFSGVTAAQLGVAGATEQDRGLASALYFSAYYVAGALGGYVPGLACERWEWPGVAVLASASTRSARGAAARAARGARRRVLTAAQDAAGRARRRRARRARSSARAASCARRGRAACGRRTG